ncbi:AraC family transcriptional regulator, partial [Mesorhizobium sp. M7A.F.Ca.US.001.04.2.1]
LGTSPRGYMRGARENVEVARRLIGPVRLESSAP